MALNNTGPISLGGSTTGQSIALELGLSATGQISLNDTNVRELAQVPSGAIIMPTNFYGKSSGNYNFTSFTFTTAGLSGPIGPTRGQCLAAYDTVTNPWLLDTNFYNVEPSIPYGVQIWTVPATATYEIDAYGARGGNNGFGSGGYGARIKIQASLTGGDKLAIVVGQPGTDVGTATQYSSGPGGGGGTFVYNYNTNYLWVAVAGGGGALTSTVNLITTQSDANGKASTQNGTSISDAGGFVAPGGTGGNGGGVSNRGILYGGGGAGWLSDGQGNYYQYGISRAGRWYGGGYLYTGGAGTTGGFGGGGASFDSPTYVSSYAWGGGGGGYSGGAGGHNGGQSDGQYGGGGGSTYNGSLQLSADGVRNGYGSVTITKL